MVFAFVGTIVLSISEVKIKRKLERLPTYPLLTGRGQREKAYGQLVEGGGWGAVKAVHFCSEDKERDCIKAPRGELATFPPLPQSHLLLCTEQSGRALTHTVRVSGLDTAEVGCLVCEH